MYLYRLLGSHSQIASHPQRGKTCPELSLHSSTIADFVIEGSKAPTNTPISTMPAPTRKFDVISSPAKIEASIIVTNGISTNPYDVPEADHLFNINK